MPYHYSAFDLRIASNVELPELLPLPSPENSPIDIHIQVGEVPPGLENPCTAGVLYQAQPGQFWFEMPAVARYLVQDGRQVTIQRFPGCLESDVRLFLLSSVFGALLHQRGLLVLHGSVIASPQGEAILLLGQTATGKSSLAAAFYQRGYTVLGDEICALRLEGNNTFQALPGIPRISLWSNSLKLLGLGSSGLPRLRPQLEKYALPLTQGFPGRPVPVKAIYILKPHTASEITLEPVQGQEKFTLLISLSYFPPFLEGLGLNASHFRMVSLVSQRLPCCCVAWPRSQTLLSETTDLIQQDWQA